MSAKFLHRCAILFFLTVCFLASCGGGSHNNNSQVAISIAPTMATLNAGGQQQFQATVTGSSNNGVQWQVNSISGGNAQIGTITATGLYTAPNPGDLTLQVTVTAVPNADMTKTANAQVTVNPGTGGDGGTGTVTVSPTRAALTLTEPRQV